MRRDRGGVWNHGHFLGFMKPGSDHQRDDSGRQNGHDPYNRLRRRCRDHNKGGDASSLPDLAYPSIGTGLRLLLEGLF